MDLSTFASLATSILGLAGLAGLATAGLLSTRRRETTRLLKELVDAQGLEISNLKHREADHVAQSLAQQAQIDTLKELVTQAAAVARLTERIDLHHEILLRRFEDLKDLVGPRTT